MTRYACRVCNGAGKIGSGWIQSGEVCLACDGDGYVFKPQHECKGCKASGKLSSYGGLSSVVCPTCQGTRFVVERQWPCRVCRGTGKSGGIFINGTCVGCQGKRYLPHRQHPCKLCKGTGKQSRWLGLRSRVCPCCDGAGLSVGDQHRCRRCDGAGTFRKVLCILCEGKCYLPYDQLKCSTCSGEGEQRGWLSTAECSACDRKGYIPSRTIVVHNSEDEEGHSDASFTGDESEQDHDHQVGSESAQQRSWWKCCYTWRWIVIFCSLSITLHFLLGSLGLSPFVLEDLG